MVQEAYPGGDMEGGKLLQQYLRPNMSPTSKFSEESKKAIYAEYMKLANQMFDDIEDRSVITAEELVYKVLELVENM